MDPGAAADQTCASERAATLVDASNSDVAAEEREWESVLGDGLEPA